MSKYYLQHPTGGVWNQKTIDEYYEMMEGPRYTMYNRKCPRCGERMVSLVNHYCDRCGDDKTKDAINLDMGKI